MMAGCSTNPSGETPSDAEEDDQAEVFELLQAIDEDVFREAFRSLPEGSFLRYERTEQRDENHRLERMIERVLRHAPEADPEVVTLIDSTGTFEEDRTPGFLQGENPPLAQLHQHLLPEEPAYASERDAEAFRYRLDPDTTLWGRSVRMAHIEARSVEGSDQSLRTVRLYVDGETNALVGLFLQQVDDGLLFGENTTFDVRLRPGSNGTWRPHLLRVHSDLHTAFLPRRVFRTVYAFYDYQ